MGPSDVRLSKLFIQITKDATDYPKYYLRGTLVPEGGE